MWRVPPLALAPVAGLGWLSGSAERDVTDGHLFVRAKHGPFLAIRVEDDVARLIDEAATVLQLEDHGALEARRFLEQIQHITAIEEMSHLGKLGPERGPASTPVMQAALVF